MTPTTAPTLKTFLISYDLAAPQANKHALASAIMMLGQGWARPLDQTWYIRANVEERDIETILGGLLGDDDGLLVQAVEREVVVANTALRWFKQRSAPVARDAGNVVVFPVVADLPGVRQDASQDVVEPFAYAEAS